MPKLKKYPKAPKATASLKVWENYKKRCEGVDKANAPIIAEAKKKETVKASVAKLKDKKRK